MDLVLYDNNLRVKCDIQFIEVQYHASQRRSQRIFLECGDNHIASQRDICTVSFKIKLLWNRQHYECLVEANKLRGKIYSTLKSFSQIFQFHLSSTHFLRQSKIKVTLAYDTSI